MSETNYIERYWRDAKPEDAIKEPPMVARFRDRETTNWGTPRELSGWDREGDLRWSSGTCFWKYCQVYDAPDPGEGWRLIDTQNEKLQSGDEFLCKNGDWVCSLNKPLEGFSGDFTYRRRITPAVTYVPFTWEDREQLRGQWITWKHENGLMIESQVNHLAEFRNGDVCFKSHDAKWLLENAKFLDTGKPVGKEVTSAN